MMKMLTSVACKYAEFPYLSENFARFPQNKSFEMKESIPHYVVRFPLHLIAIQRRKA